MEKTDRSKNIQIAPKSTSEDDQSVSMQALYNLDEIEEVAKRKLSKKARALFSSSSDYQLTKQWNQNVYRNLVLRPRMLIDVSHCDISTSLLGHKTAIPIYVSPSAAAQLAHPTGERGIAKAISQFGALQIISNNASMTLEEIVEGSPPGQLFGWQLYVQTDRKKSEAWLERINKMKDKFKFVCLTLDAPIPEKREKDERQQLTNLSLPQTPAPTAGEDAHSGVTDHIVSRKLFTAEAARTIIWKETLPWLAKHTSLPIVLKGVQTHEDAYLAAQCSPQVKGIILSNHGGRSLDTTSPAVYTLLEIRKYCPEVFEKVEVWVDGGIKRGTDVVKALCLGAKAVGIGRAALYGLAAGGPEGVARTFESMLSALSKL